MYCYDPLIRDRRIFDDICIRSQLFVRWISKRVNVANTSWQNIYGGSWLYIKERLKKYERLFTGQDFAHEYNNISCWLNIGMTNGKYEYLITLRIFRVTKYYVGLLHACTTKWQSLLAPVNIAFILFYFCNYILFHVSYTVFLNACLFKQIVYVSKWNANTLGIYTLSTTNYVQIIHHLRKKTRRWYKTLAISKCILKKKSTFSLK